MSTDSQHMNTETNATAPGDTAEKPQAGDTEDVIVIKNLNKWYGNFHVLKDINLTVKKGEKIVICGPSGYGKSTTIRCINRLEEFQRGSLTVNGIEMIDDVKNIENIRREVGMVFQHFNLFPHLSILENLTLGPIWVQKKPKEEANAIAMKYLERVKIPEQADKFPCLLYTSPSPRDA